MSLCKICLCSDPDKDLSQLQFTENAHQSGEYILLFCLGIQVIKDSGESTKFCERCFTKLAEFHQFKYLALKNQATLSCLGLQKYIEKDIKSEVLSQNSDNDDIYDEPLIDYSELQEQKPLEELPSLTNNELVLDVPITLDLKQEQSDNELSTSKKRKSGTIGSTKKGKSSKNAPASRNVGKQLKTKYELGKHIYKTEEQPNLVACAICNKTFTSKGSLNYHIEMHKRKKIECTHCNKIFLCTRTLERHLQNKHKSMQESGTYFCASCDEMCISKKRLETHIIKNHPEQLSAAFKAIKMFPCDLCEKSYYGRKNLRNHLRAVHGGCKAQCPICKKRFAESYLQVHIRTKHENETLPYRCDTCDRKFVTKGLLKRHVSVHTGVKPYSCDLCDTKFRLKYSVTLHKAQVHDKLKNHVCHICSKGYFSASLLQRHIKAHETAINYVPGTIKKDILRTVTCPDCGKPLASAETLKHHRLLHKAQKNFCEICGLAFATRKYVRNHMKTHLQIKKYNCKFCDTSFVRCGARRRHELEVHIKKGEKRPPRKDTRKNRIRKKKVKTQASTVSESEPKNSQELGLNLH